MLGSNCSGYSWNGLRISSRYLDLACSYSYCRHWLSLVWLNTLSLTKGLDMVDKAGVGGKKWISQKWLSNETNKQKTNNIDNTDHTLMSVGSVGDGIAHPSFFLAPSLQRGWRINPITVKILDHVIFNKKELSSAAQGDYQEPYWWHTNTLRWVEDNWLDRLYITMEMYNDLASV